jgi:hypothetical protein
VFAVLLFCTGLTTWVAFFDLDLLSPVVALTGVGTDLVSALWCRVPHAFSFLWHCMHRVGAAPPDRL